MANESSAVSISDSQEESNNQLIVDVILSISLEFKDLLTNRSTKYCSSKKKKFKHPTHAFLSAPEADQRDILYNMIQSMEIPFPLENIYWDLKRSSEIDFPLLNLHIGHLLACSKIKNLDEIMDGLLIAARGSARDKDDYLQIHIVKRQIFSIKGVHEAKQILMDWFEESRNCKEFMYCIQRGALPMYRQVGIWLVQPTTNREAIILGGDHCCSICMEELGKKKLLMRFCSHIFHEYCIFQWFLVKPTCPLCRSELLKVIQGNTRLLYFDRSPDEIDCSEY